MATAPFSNWFRKFGRFACTAGLLLCSDTVALAIVGNASPATPEIRRHVVLITSSSGSFCSGTLIAPLLVLTAGHCVNNVDSYKLIKFSSNGSPIFFDVALATRHPQFDLNAFLKHRATADVALLKLANSLGPEYAPATLAEATKRVSVGDQFVIAGFGVSVRGDGRTGGTLRTARLTATGQPGSLQIRLVDPATDNRKSGLGACTGDSGAPAFDESRAIVGILSWSTAAGNEDGCGGLSGITPLSRYLPWIRETAKKVGAPIPADR